MSPSDTSAKPLLVRPNTDIDDHLPSDQVIGITRATHRGGKRSAIRTGGRGVHLQLAPTGGSHVPRRRRAMWHAERIDFGLRKVETR